MAIYRTICLSFWTDTKVVDNFTPEDKYFYLYCLTNPHTNLCGCYEISKKQMATELGYSIDSIDNLLDRFEHKHKLVCISKETNELLILNWHKYNWTNSPKFRKPLLEEIKKIKNKSFKEYLNSLFDNNGDMVSIPYEYSIDTSDTVTVTDTVTDTIPNNKKIEKKIKKVQYAEFVSMKTEEYQKLIENYGEEFTKQCIETLDNYKGANGKKYKDDYRAILNWVIDRVKEKRKSNMPKKEETNEERLRRLKGG